MPSISPPSLVLVTGGSGFVGSGVISSLLSNDFSVSAAVRSDEETFDLKATFNSEVSEGKLSFVYFTDIAEPGVFDEAVKGVKGIVHCASPVPSTIDPNQHPDVTINTAKEGVLGILTSAGKCGTTVQRVVITGSAAAVMEPKEAGYVYTESDWNISAPASVKDMDYEAPVPLRYSASKVIAEQAAWNWMGDNQTSFDLVTILPSFVWGKSPISSQSHYHTGSSGLLLTGISQAISGELKDQRASETTELVDVRDVGEGHVRALIVQEATNQRFILAAGSISWNEILRVLRERSISTISPLPEEKSGSSEAKGTTHCSTDKARHILGIAYRPIAETIYDTVQGAISLG
ncbi:methylglyoxal reductase (NADPH-dependent) gre2 [Serendipita sp. 399]|nr:methylglyoxal reductase (NADPH-dependent) gre2 [Serendipita sp. 399]